MPYVYDYKKFGHYDSPGFLVVTDGEIAPKNGYHKSTFMFFWLNIFNPGSNNRIVYV